MKMLWLVFTALGFCFIASGCASADHERADYHNRRAKEEAKSLNLGKAVDEKHKANDAERDAHKDPLP
ncbi:MAG TPA: hypothetical protein VGL86_28270 [Polyangia bacterium]|jgi:hypothetical protein